MSIQSMLRRLARLEKRRVAVWPVFHVPNFHAASVEQLVPDRSGWDWPAVWEEVHTTVPVTDPCDAAFAELDQQHPETITTTTE